MTKHTYTLQKIIEKEKFYYVNPDITQENFPSPDKVETEGWKLLRFEKSFSSEEALEFCKKEGLRPANIYELLLWKGEHGTELEDHEWCLAFGQTWKDSDGDHGVPRVHRHSDGGWEFGLGHFEGDWYGAYCLLCFCDKPLDTHALSETESSGSLTHETKEKIKKWIFDNHMHHEDSPTNDCQEADAPYVNSLNLEKFIESL